MNFGLRIIFISTIITLALPEFSEAAQLRTLRGMVLEDLPLGQRNIQLYFQRATAMDTVPVPKSVKDTITTPQMTLTISTAPGNVSKNFQFYENYEEFERAVTAARADEIQVVFLDHSVPLTSPAKDLSTLSSPTQVGSGPKREMGQKMLDAAKLVQQRHPHALIIANSSDSLHRLEFTDAQKSLFFYDLNKSGDAKVHRHLDHLIRKHLQLETDAKYARQLWTHERVETKQMVRRGEITEREQVTRLVHFGFQQAKRSLSFTGRKRGRSLRTFTDDPPPIAHASFGESPRSHNSHSSPTLRRKDSESGSDVGPSGTVAMDTGQ